MNLWQWPSMTKSPEASFQVHMCLSLCYHTTGATCPPLIQVSSASHPGFKNESEFQAQAPEES